MKEIKKGLKISIVIPTWNEEKNIAHVLRDVKNFFKKEGYDYEILVIDKYSVDKTAEIAKKFGAKVIYDSGGKGAALIKGMKLAKGDIIITMDADCSMVAKEMGLLIEGIKCGYDICMGSRFIQGGGTEDMPWYRKLGNKFFVFLVNLIWGMRYSDLCYGYRAFNRKAIKRLNLKSEGFGIETEISIKAAKKGLKVLEVPSFEKSRRSGKGKLRTFRDGFKILSTIIREFLSKE
ncbi:MAG: glycosyltransferase family 2 protein [Candidatus Aenigmatarchaeota archaeon]